MLLGKEKGGGSWRMIKVNVILGRVKGKIGMENVGMMMKVKGMIMGNLGG